MLCQFYCFQQKCKLEKIFLCLTKLKITLLDWLFQIFQLNFLMHSDTGKQKPLHPSLQAKLQLLQHIQKGNIQQVKHLAYALSKVNNTNPKLYSKLTSFVKKHQQELKNIDSQSDEEEQSPQIENIDGDFTEGKEWDSQDSIQYEEDEEGEEDGNAQNNQPYDEKIGALKHQLQNKREPSNEGKSSMLKRSGSSKKLLQQDGKTFQFKSPVREVYKSPELKFPSGQFKSPARVVNKSPGLKPSNSKAQLHKNSAIGKTIKSSSKALLKL